MREGEEDPISQVKDVSKRSPGNRSIKDLGHVRPRIPKLSAKGREGGRRIEGRAVL
jgi:hypothetical protein